MSVDAAADSEFSTYTLAIHDMGHSASRAQGFAWALSNDRLRMVLDTGLIVTYARPFTEGRGSGFPISAEDFVPANTQGLHAKMLELRHKVQAHMDASAPEGFQRVVTRTEEPGVSSVTFRGPRPPGSR